MPIVPAGGPGAPGGPPPQPTGFGGPAEPPEPPRDNRPLIIGGIIALVALIVVGVILLSRGDDDTIESVDSIAITTDSTTTTSTTVVDTTVVDTTTTVPDTTTSTTSTTSTTTTTTVAPTTTAAPTTVVETTTTITATIPVVTVPPAPAATLWDIIQNSPDLSAFRTAIANAGLIDLLDGPEPVTVFVPSNAAIELFQAGVGNDALLTDADFLRHHIVDGALRSADVFAVTSLDTAASDTIVVDANAATVDDAKLVVIDVEAPAGGVLHVVDRVLVATP